MYCRFAKKLLLITLLSFTCMTSSVSAASFNPCRFTAVLSLPSDTDLAEVEVHFTNGHYYDPDSRGTYQIMKVLRSDVTGDGRARRL